jgi:hypothetical protein
MNGRCRLTRAAHARIRRAQLKQAVAFYEGKAVDVLGN